jgi:hypothetical protein
MKRSALVITRCSLKRELSGQDALAFGGRPYGLFREYRGPH